MTVIVKPMENITLGAEVTGIRLADLAPEDWTSIYDAFLEFGVLVFPGQHLTEEEQNNFAKDSVKQNNCHRYKKAPRYQSLIKNQTAHWRHQTTRATSCFGETRAGTPTAHTCPWHQRQPCYRRSKSRTKEEKPNLPICAQLGMN